MSLHSDLLALAHRLTLLDRRKPKQANLRRSVSTAYYALFHRLTASAVAIIGPNLQESAALQLQRWFDHREMKHVAGMFSSAVPPRQIAAVLAMPPSVELQSVAQTFVRLQGARHAADYDLSSHWTRHVVQDYVQSTRDAFDAWTRIRRSHEANVFALALLSPKLFDRERP